MINLILSATYVKYNIGHSSEAEIPDTNMEDSAQANEELIRRSIKSDVNL